MQARIIEVPSAVVNKEISRVLFGACAIVTLYVLTVYFFTMAARLSVFTKDFMKKFEEDHKKAFNLTTAPEYGYPDSGNGRFAKKLAYADWFKMNNGQRAQINFLEQITFMVISTVVVGLVYPDWAFWLQLGIVFGRLAFSIGYTRSGPDARLVGALTMDICILAALVLSVSSIMKLVSN